MKIRLCESLIVEDIESVKSRYTVDDKTFDKILNFDPTYKEGSNSVGKYTKWLLDKFKALGFPKLALVRGDLIDVETGEVYIKGSDISKFDDLKSTLPNKDIGQFKTLDDFSNVCDTLSADNLTDRQKERRLRNSDSNKDIKLVLDTPNWKVYTPLSYSGSCTLGKGTRWCTAYSDDDSAYGRYTQRGPLYVIISKSNPSEKYQFHIQTQSFMDASDKGITPEAFSKLWEDEELRKLFSDVTKNIDIDASSRSVPVHIAMTRFPDNLPDEIRKVILYRTAYVRGSDVILSKNLMNTLINLQFGDIEEDDENPFYDRNFYEDIIEGEWEKLITEELSELLSNESQKVGLEFSLYSTSPFLIKLTHIPNSDKEIVFTKMTDSISVLKRTANKVGNERLSKLWQSPKLKSFNPEDYVDAFKEKYGNRYLG